MATTARSMHMGKGPRSSVPLSAAKDLALLRSVSRSDAKGEAGYVAEAWLAAALGVPVSHAAQASALALRTLPGLPAPKSPSVMACDPNAAGRPLRSRGFFSLFGIASGGSPAHRHQRGVVAGVSRE